MRWQSGRRSENVEDRRGRVAKKGAAMGGGVLIITIIIALLSGKGPSEILGLVLNNVQKKATSGPVSQKRKATPQEERLADFTKVVLGYTEDAWKDIFQHQGKTYKQPKLVLFTGAVNSACGYTSAAVGPFYCPGDQKVYLDLSFFAELHKRFKAPGDFAQAYVIAHEIGHHIQTLTGISQKAHRMKRGLSKAAANKISVRQELQADCFAGVWAHHTNKKKKILEEGDIEEALKAAKAIGDDALQKAAQGYAVPDSFTHGTSQQRSRWFRKGFDSGNMTNCDTFNAASL